MICEYVNLSSQMLVYAVLLRSFALLSVKFPSLKLRLCKKNDKYEVCGITLSYFQMQCNYVLVVCVPETFGIEWVYIAVTFSCNWEKFSAGYISPECSAFTLIHFSFYIAIFTLLFLGAIGKHSLLATRLLSF